MKRLLLALGSALTLLSRPAGAIPPPAFLATNVTDLASSANSSISVILDTEIAAAFTTGSDVSSLYSVQAEVNPSFAVTGVPITRTAVGYVAMLYSDVSGAPGSLLGSANGLGNPSSDNVLVTFSPFTNTLAADTTYFLVIKNFNPYYIGGWDSTTSLTQSSPDGWTISTGYEVMGDSTVLTTSTPLFSIETTPEPGTLALGALGAAAFWRLRRKTA